ncbi:hypothetical protein Ga0466249_004313 [Sporomusaceae bacterium BoRhaA]|uniref:hypothetical protein n=1 Tax=Pelorhabdus rhamnosifermentans TaxID=2772457 RepID=UPI001C060949|nr:hypothetical protein [Pelorhabdus rhamnosifermentans]MBU2703177.1 hypothetical protein [Pelorhabdus rhamnosifermentans]
MANKDIRVKIALSLIPKWKIAEMVGIADATFSRWLRRELSEEKKQRILVAIDKLAKGATNNGTCQ